jgi:hypothetical protein
MERGIECGIRFTRNVLMLPDAEFEARLAVMIPQVRTALQQQRTVHHTQQGLATSKSGDSAFAARTVELYCRVKDTADIIDPLSKGIECGIRIKQFALDLGEQAYDAYLGECLAGFRTSVLEQRRMFVQLESRKSVQVDDAMKGIELYCGTKNSCS